MKYFFTHVAVALAVMSVTVSVMHSQQSASQTQRYLQFENDDVNVWKSVVVPNAR
jgi:hypothetical protein